MSRSDRAAMLICLAIFCASLYVSLNILEGIPHLEDEFAFVWQAQVITHGQLVIASPQPDPDSFKVPFVVDFQGKRFAKYPPGWPAVLAVGEIFHARSFVNPLLTGLSFWLIYRLIKKLLDDKTALLAICLGFTSPFVWMNSGSLLSHSWTLFLSIVFSNAWLDAFTEPNHALPPRISRILPCVVAALSLALLALSRPWTAVAIALPFTLPSLYLLIMGSRQNQIRILVFGVICSSVTALYLLWQFTATGSPWLNPYTLWWPYDQVGFGPGIGRQPGGYSPYYAWHNTLAGLYSANNDLFGWPLISWLFIPFGLVACLKNRRLWLVILTLPSIIIAYALYWIPSWVTGPRYYYEALPAALLLSAAGLRWLAGGQVGGWRQCPWKPSGRFRFAIAAFLISSLVTANLVYYLPHRLEGLRGLYGVSANCIDPFKSLRLAEQPAIIFVHLKENFLEYACIARLNSPYLDTKLIFAVSQDRQVDTEISRAYSNRVVFDYDVNSNQLIRASQENRESAK